MKNKLQRVFIYFIATTIVFVTAFAVFGPEGKKINLKEIDFTTSSSGQLYFKNIRSYFYTNEVRDDANFILYKIGSREFDPHLNNLSFVLVSNWLMNECYIVVDSKFNDFTIKWQYEDTNGEFELLGEDNRSHFVFAAQLFKQLDRKAETSIVSFTGETPLSEGEKASLHTSLKDYFKLVGKLR
tara:strand:+ start:258 stop:809 length:552 start_codon:yes stop_codon:yes gene_type:complete